MRIGKLFVGWRSMPADEAVQFGLSAHSTWRGLFVEWGTAMDGFGVLLMVEERQCSR